jgi:hypothetical protein
VSEDILAFRRGEVGISLSGGGLSACAISESPKQASNRELKSAVVVWILVGVFIITFLPKISSGCQDKCF